jgi:transposase InsO family protein
MTDAARLDQLRAELKYLRDRRDLYRAKVYGPRPARLSRLREIEREHDLAESRLRRAEQAAST